MIDRLYNRTKEICTFDIDEPKLRYHRLIVGGLVAFSLIIVQAFISAKIADAAEWISIVSFAIAIPLLVMFIFIYGIGNIPIETTPFAGALYFGGLFIDICGLDAAFWHVSWIAGLLFIVSGLLAFAVYIGNEIEHEEKHAQTLASNQPPQPPTS